MPMIKTSLIIYAMENAELDEIAEILADKCHDFDGVIAVEQVDADLPRSYGFLYGSQEAIDKIEDEYYHGLSDEEDDDAN